VTRRRKPRAPQPDAVKNLAGFIPEPTHKNAVLAVLRAAEKPLLLREIRERAGLPATDAHRVMDRLAKSRPPVVSRFKVLMSETHASLSKLIGRDCQKRRPMFLYELVDNGERQ
jgi:hypothetical protein